MITTYYKDFYGCTASIKSDGNSALLTIRTHSGEIIYKKRYTTSHGARIALGKQSDSWKFVSQFGKIRIKL